MKYLKTRRLTHGGGLWFPIVCGRKNRRYHWQIIRVGHSWGNWQSAEKEGRELLHSLKEAK